VENSILATNERQEEVQQELFILKLVDRILSITDKGLPDENGNTPKNCVYDNPGPKPQPKY
jgi:hypothetical protein